MELTPDDVSLLRAIRDGVDVFSMVTARKLRVLARKAPHLLQITDAMGHYSRWTREPYFGAIATNDGKALLDEIT